MLTNGVLLNHQVACELKDSGIVAVGIPIDSVEPEVHDNLRNVPGTFARALNAIRACVDVGIEVIITTMALKNTFEEMPRRIEFISRLGIDQVAVYDLVPAGRGKAIMDCAMTQEQRFSLIRYLQRQQEKGEMVFTMSGGQPLYPQIVSQMHESNGTKPRDLLLKQFWIHGRTGCHAGISYFSLRPNGDVYPCTFLPVKVGNIREQTITSIWQESRVFGELRERRLLKGKCGQCSYRESCGGCRGRAYAWGNSDYLESDPVCPEDLLSEERVFSGSIERFGWCVG
jgi:radical SAM protein with 4Fe4S-binding SPASM domain